MSDKVYCSECKYLEYKDEEYICNHKDNMKVVDNSNWFIRRDKDLEDQDSPQILNQDNSCVWYKGEKK